MACTDWSSGLEALRAFAFRDAVFCWYQGDGGVATGIGGPAFALLIMGGVGMYIYGKTESYALVTVLLIVLGGVFLPYVAPVGLSIGQLLFVLMLAVAPLLVLWRLGKI